MIVSFSDAATEDFFHGDNTAKARRIPSEIHDKLSDKLDVLNAANTLDDLRVPPGNHLEALKGELNGYHSIRVNKQWRLVFRWTAAGPEDVRVADYH